MESEEVSPSKVADSAYELANDGRLSDAVDLIRVYTKRHPHGGLLSNLGDLLSNEDPEGALEAYGQAIELGYCAHVNRGLLRERLGDEDGAEADYRAALLLDGEDVSALVNLGTLELSRGSLQEASRHLRLAYQLDETVAWQYADVLLEEEKFAQAERLIRRAIELGETRAELDLARILMRKNEPAEEHFVAAVAAGARGARREYAEYLDAQGSPSQAIRVASEGVRVGELECHATLAVLYESTGQRRKALEHYKLAIDSGFGEYFEDASKLRALLGGAG